MLACWPNLACLLSCQTGETGGMTSPRSAIWPVRLVPPTGETQGRCQANFSGFQATAGAREAEALPMTPADVPVAHDVSQVAASVLFDE